MVKENQRDRTKSQLGTTLKTLLRQKPLSQIRVRELTEQCGIRRQSFYDHFTDVYDLFAWSIRQERADLLARQRVCLTWQQVLEDLLAHTAADRAYYQALLESRGRQGLRDTFQDAVEQMLRQTMVYYEVRGGAVRDDAAEAVRLQCWSAILLALLEGWICGELEQPPKLLIAHLEQLAEDSAVGMAWQNLSRRENGE